MVTNQTGCKEFLMQNKQKFGITETNIRPEQLDICAQQVRCIAAKRINEEIVLPSMSTFINSCTGLVDTAGGIDTQFASLRVTHAHEELVDCDTDCPGVKVTIKGQIIVRTKPTACNCTVSYMAIPVELVSETIREFYSTYNGERVRCLKNELPYIDGSCMVINLSCRVCREVCGGCSRYVAQIQGSIVDKLWKMENIWVEGYRPYTAPAVTVCDRFEKDLCCGGFEQGKGEDYAFCCGEDCNDCGCGCEAVPDNGCANGTNHGCCIHPNCGSGCAYPNCGCGCGTNCNGNCGANCTGGCGANGNNCNINCNTACGINCGICDD